MMIKFDFWPSASSQEADCGRKRSIVHLWLTQGIGGPDRLALLSGLESTQMHPAREEVFKPAVIAHDAVDDTATRAHDLSRQ
jgi:hypothetical protein